jgi:transcription initiation factor IIE alpha subunit
VDDLDFQNFKGIYFNEDPNRKYQCPETGAHFEYYDLCKRISGLKEKRKVIDKQLGIESDSPVEKKNERRIEIIGQP